MITTLLFDLDDTLYPPSAGIMGQIRHRILTYIQDRFRLSQEEADTLRRHYLHTYGTTMRGLQINHGIDPDDYLHHVHDFPLQDYIQPNPRLDAALQAIPQDKVVFTNASREHAERVLDVLGIRARFSRIVDVRDMEYESKPQPGAYRRVCELLHVRPEACLLVEDNVRNLRPAKALGMVTALVHLDGTRENDAADYVIRRIEEIEQVVQQIATGAGSP